jgi:hypothetical protein
MPLFDLNLTNKTDRRCVCICSIVSKLKLLLLTWQLPDVGGGRIFVAGALAKAAWLQFRPRRQLLAAGRGRRQCGGGGAAVSGRWRGQRQGGGGSLAAAIAAWQRRHRGGGTVAAAVAWLWRQLQRRTCVILLRGNTGCRISQLVRAGSGDRRGLRKTQHSKLNRDLSCLLHLRKKSSL